MTDIEMPEETFGNAVNWRKQWLPTPKWVVALVVGAGGLATAYVEAGEWSDTLMIMAITLGVERVAAYVSPNQRR